ncbi:MAG: hypothetical protein M3464_12450 [Chloroflexota bacterium]|nr:hypothetical protein [Chloroflexota bacterium]
MRPLALAAGAQIGFDEGVAIGRQIDVGVDNQIDVGVEQKIEIDAVATDCLAAGGVAAKDIAGNLMDHGGRRGRLGAAAGPIDRGLEEGAAPPSTPAGGEERPPGRELLLQAAIERLPEAPARIRLSRLTFAPLGFTTEAGRPGPTFVLIESGNLTIDADDPATVLAADGGDEPAPLTGIVSVGPGDRLALPAGTAYTLRHDGAAPAVALVAVILPAGAGEAGPAADFARDAGGLTVQPLGEGVAAVLPPDRAAVTLERFVLSTGLGVPSYPGPVLVAVEAGGFASTLDAGDIQRAPGGRAAHRGARSGLRGRDWRCGLFPRGNGSDAAAHRQRRPGVAAPRHPAPARRLVTGRRHRQRHEPASGSAAEGHPSRQSIASTPALLIVSCIPHRRFSPVDSSVLYVELDILERFS